MTANYLDDLSGPSEADLAEIEAGTYEDPEEIDLDEEYPHEDED